MKNKPVKLKCDLIHNRFVWLRTNREMWTIQIFIFTAWLKGYHYWYRIALWKFGVDLSVNPFCGHIHLAIGRRFFDYFFFEYYARKSVVLK